MREHPWNIEYALRVHTGGKLDHFEMLKGSQASFSGVTITPPLARMLAELPPEKIKIMIEEHLAWLESRDN